jgi:hypothetical protein
MNRYRRSAVAVIWAIGVEAFAIGGLHAQGASTVNAPLRPYGDDALTGSPGCLNSASATCGSKPQSPPSSDMNVDFNSGFGAPVSEGDGASLRVQGDAAAMRLEARQVRIKAVLAALAAALNFSCRFPIALDDVINGTYSGSLRQVLSRVLEGYDYAIRHDSSKLEVIIIGKSGVRGVVPVATAMLVNPYHPLRERRRAALLGIDQHRTSAPSASGARERTGPVDEAVPR